MADIKPIETVYQGYRFRSRLEARHAVFFDALGVEWQYELEGFDLGRDDAQDYGAYLPDFRLTNVFPPMLESELVPSSSAVPTTPPIWFEVKGSKPDNSVYVKTARLARASREPVAVTYDEVADTVFCVLLPVWDPRTGATCTLLFKTSYHWCKCYQCGRISIEFDVGSFMPCSSCRDFRAETAVQRRLHPDIVRAVRAARGARFEHGENGAV